MLSLMLASLLAAPHAGAPITAIEPEPQWMLYADCSAAHYANAQIIDLNRTAAQKKAILQLGRRYSAVATDQLRGGPGPHHVDKAFEQSKAYILEKTRLLALRTRPDVQAAIARCPAPPK
jgi:hypothetical protein